MFKYWYYLFKTDFIEKNHNVVTDSMENLAKVAVGWLGKKENECVSQKNFKSMGLSLKNELKNLIVKLESTVIVFEFSMISNKGINTINIIF